MCPSMFVRSVSPPTVIICRVSHLTSVIASLYTDNIARHLRPEARMSSPKFRPSARRRTIDDVVVIQADTGKPVEEVPEHLQVQLRTSIDHDRVNLCGVMYQRCGGGYR